MPQRTGTASLAERLGLNVFLLRKTRYPQLTQEELSERSGLAVNTIVNVETNRIPGRDVVAIRLDTVERLADALEVPPLSLFEDPFGDERTTRVYLNGLHHELLDLTDQVAS